MSDHPPPSGPPTPRPDAVAEDWSGWHRMHPITPFIKGWKAIVAVFAVATGQNYQYLINLSQTDATVRRFGGWGVVAGVFAAAVLVVLLVCFLSWRVARYRLEDNVVHSVSGIIFRQRRQVRLDRLQAVDVAQPLLARVFGLAKLTLQVAGGSDSSIDIAFLRESEAVTLRADLLARAAGLAAPAAPLAGPQPAPTGSDDGPAPASVTMRAALAASAAAPTEQRPAADGEQYRTAQAPTEQHCAAPAEGAEQHFPEAAERPIFTVPAGRLVASMAMTSLTFWLLAGVATVVIIAINARELTTIIAAAPFVLAVGGVAWSRFNREYGFRAAISADGIRLAHGLTELRRQTVPPGRVQALAVSQPPLWRLTGWWRVEMNVAGYGYAEDEQQASVLLPVGSREQVAQALWLVFADATDQLDPRLLEAAMTGSGPGEGLECAPRPARWLSPIGWRRRAASLGSTAVVLRRGWVVRKVYIVPYARIQSLAINQGPLQRSLDLAGVAVHCAPGPVNATLDHLGADQVAELVDHLTVAARRARITARPERWMSEGSDSPG